MVCTLIRNDICHNKGQNLLADLIGCASLVYNILTTTMTNNVVKKELRPRWTIIDLLNPLLTLFPSCGYSNISLVFLTISQHSRKNSLSHLLVDLTWLRQLSNKLSTREVTKLQIVHRTREKEVWYRGFYTLFSTKMKATLATISWKITVQKQLKFHWTWT